MPRWKVPSENIVYADRDGNIGEHSVGLAPLRKKWTGLLPVPGAGGYEWSGFVPTEELPHQFNPAAGFVATANHKMIPEGYPYKVGYSWADALSFPTHLSGAAESQSGDKLDVEALERFAVRRALSAGDAIDRTPACGHRFTRNPPLRPSFCCGGTAK